DRAQRRHDRTPDGASPRGSASGPGSEPSVCGCTDAVGARTDRALDARNERQDEKAERPCIARLESRQPTIAAPWLAAPLPPDRADRSLVHHRALLHATGGGRRCPAIPPQETARDDPRTG